MAQCKQIKEEKVGIILIGECREVEVVLGGCKLQEESN